MEKVYRIGTKQHEGRKSGVNHVVSRLCWKPKKNSCKLIIIRVNCERKKKALFMKHRVYVRLMSSSLFPNSRNLRNSIALLLYVYLDFCAPKYFAQTRPTKFLDNFRLRRVSWSSFLFSFRRQRLLKSRQVLKLPPLLLHPLLRLPSLADPSV